MPGGTPRADRRSGDPGRRVDGPPGPSGPSGTTLRMLAFGAASVLLIGTALIAGGVGPWTGRPIDTSPPVLPTQPPQTLPTFSLAEAPEQPQSDPVALGWGIRLVVIIVIGLIVAGVLWYLATKLLSIRAAGRNAGLHTQRIDALRTGPPPPPTVEGESGRNFDPRAAADAIISCWLWVEKAAEAGVFTRRDQDTPTEFLERFVEHTAGGAGAATSGDIAASTAVEDPGAGLPTADSARVEQAATVLLPLYQRARFDHVALTADAALQARQAAQVLCDVAGSRAAARAVEAGESADRPAGSPRGHRR